MHLKQMCLCPELSPWIVCRISFVIFVLFRCRINCISMDLIRIEQVEKNDRMVHSDVENRLFDSILTIQDQLVPKHPKHALIQPNKKHNQ